MATFNTLLYYFQTYGVLDFLLPFLLVFTITYAILKKIKLLGDKRFDIMVAFILGLSFVVPHILGVYPLGYDPVAVLNGTLPSISLVAVAAVMMLLLMGIFGTDFAKSAAPFIAVIAIAFVVYIFGAALDLWRGPYDIFYWWSAEVTELIVILLIFGGVVYFITKDPNDKSQGSELLSNFGKLFEKK